MVMTAGERERRLLCPFVPPLIIVKRDLVLNGLLLLPYAASLAPPLYELFIIMLASCESS